MIRRADTTDLDALEVLEGECFTTERFSRRRLAYLLVDERAVALVWDDGGVGGSMIMLLRSDSPAARVYGLCVSPPLRGRGIGKGLMLAAEGIARERGRTSIRLEVRMDSPARELYHSMGYRDVRRLPDYYAKGEDGMRMELSLQR